MDRVSEQSRAVPPFATDLIPIIEARREALPVFSVENLAEIRSRVTGGGAGLPATDLTLGGRVQRVDREIPGGPGHPPVTVTVLSPASSGDSLRPVIVYLHGGGMVVGERMTGIEQVLPHVVESDAVIVAVEYRLAPEHPDPAPVEDCYAALSWTARHAHELGVDPERIMVYGFSAGGGLAAGLALLSRDRGYPRISHQVLSGPMLDDRQQTISSQMLDGEGLWDRNANAMAWKALLGDRQGGPEVSIYAAPARAQDLSRLPATYIDCGSSETFRDESITYAQRLSEAGVVVDLHVWGGAFHNFDAWPAGDLAAISRELRAGYVTRALR